MTETSREFELEPGERVVFTARKHWILFAADLVPYLVLAILPFVLAAVLSFVPLLAPYSFSWASPLPRAILGIWLVIIWTPAWGSFALYYLNVWILTSTRIVEIRQTGFFYREVSSVLLNRVQDVSTDVDGMLESLLHIGSIRVQSAGAVDEFKMSGISRPEVMRDAILRLVEKEPEEGAGV